MIDWVTANIPFSHEKRLLGGRLLSIDQDGAVDWETAKSLPVVGSHDQRIHVLAHGDGWVRIHGNPAKFLQGHNLFGSDDLRSLVVETMTKVCESVSVAVQPADLRAWMLGNYDISRVDITQMYSLETVQRVRAWLYAAERQSKSRHGRPLCRGGTVYWGKHSRRWAMKAYSKGDELRSDKSHKLPELPSRDLLIEYAEDKLRLEIVLRAMQLKDIGFARGSAWDLQTPSRLFAEYLGSIQMSDQFTLPETAISELPPRLIAVYRLWKAGEDLRAMYPKNTFYRYRRQLREFSIDIAIIQPRRNDNVVPLVHALRPQAVAEVPDWAIGTDLYFDPARLKLALA